jgi:hypothetical protein
MNKLEPVNWTDNAMDAAIEDALRTAPLDNVPPGLYQAVMQQVQAQNLPTQPVPFQKMGFRISWLDLALSLFGAGMLALTGLMWNWLPAPMADYLRMQALYGGQQLIYGNPTVLIWCALALAALFCGLLAGLWSCLRLGICNRRAV